MFIINGLLSPHWMPDQISSGPPKSFLLLFFLYLFATIPLVPVVCRCSEALARVRATLLWPRRLGLPRQLAQYPCCCHSACVAQSLITFISAALCMQYTLFSIANIHRGLVILIYPVSCVSLPHKSTRSRSTEHAWHKQMQTLFIKMLAFSSFLITKPLHT